MTVSSSHLTQLADFTAAKRAASLTGSLLGLDLPARDRVMAEQVAAFEQALEAARARAAETGVAVELDGAGLSLTDGGDTWIIQPDGRMDRRYSRHEGFAAFLSAVASRPGVDWRRPAPSRARLEAAYQGFWSPSATNWQPTRVIELVGAPAQALARLAGWEAPVDFPLLALVRRDHYESLLGDVLEPFGLEVTAREESIDVGIFAHTLVMAAVSAGLAADEHVFAAEQVAEATAVLKAELERRVAVLTGAAADPLAAQEASQLAALAAMLGEGRYFADSLLAVGEPLAPIPPYPAFERVVAEHSTQRVASSGAELSSEMLNGLWEAAVGSLPGAHRGLVKFATFSWHDRVPAMIGQAMFESLYGVGADPEAKSGGEGGILTAVTVKNYLLHLDRTDPGGLDASLPDDWRDLDEAALRPHTKQMAVHARHVRRYMRERLLRDGKYRLDGDRIVDAEGRPLTLPLLVRLMKALASTFGNFFLKFQNTHPQNAVLLADAAHPDGHRAWRAVGQVAAAITFLSRAEGTTSIIKTGPIDLARDPIGRILAANPGDLPQLRPFQAELAAGRLLPAMTFQVGLPLTGSDVVDAGTPGEHSGYEERKRDKRPPREDFTWHYFPAL